MEFVFLGRCYPVARAELRIGFDPGPRLSLAFATGPNRPSPAEVAQQALQGSRAALQHGGSRLEFSLLGADVGSNESEADGVSGVVLEEGLLNWFATPLTAPSPLLVYQRTPPPGGQGGKDGDSTGWAFLNRLTEDRLGPGPAALQQQVDAALPVAACVCRPVGWHNFHFLDLLLATLSQRVPGLAGWCAVNAANQPLRFVTSTEPTLRLDTAWGAAAGCRIGRIPYARGLGPDCYLQRDLGEGAQRPLDPIKLLAVAARLGRPTKAGDAADTGLTAAEVVQFPTMPTAINWKGKSFFAREVGVVVSRKEPDQTFKVVARVRLGSPDPTAQFLSPPPPLLLPARFKAWHQIAGQDRPILAQVKPQADAWQVVGPDHRPDPELLLLAELLLPAAPRQEFAGLYVRREEDDLLRLLVGSGGPPLALGGPQACLTELEARDLTLNAGRVVLSCTPVNVPLADADGVHLDHDTREVVLQVQAVNQLILSPNDLARFTRKLRVDDRLDVRPGSQ